MAARSGLKIRSTITPYEARLLRNAEIKSARQKDRQTIRFRRIAMSPIVPSTPFGWTNSRDELKYLDTSMQDGTFLCDTTGKVACLNLIAQGDDNVNRQGRQISPKSIRIRGIIQPVDSNISNCMCRCILVWDNAPNSGSIATITNILTSSNSTAMTNLDFRARFKIIRDESWAFGESSDTSGVTRASMPGPDILDWFVPLAKYPKMTYSGTTATIGSIATGALLFVTIGNVAANTGGEFKGQARLRFADS